MRKIYWIAICLIILGLIGAVAYKERRTLKQFVRKHFKTEKPLPIPFEVYAYEASLKHGVDRELILAVIWRESKFDPLAKGAAGERGLMQIMPAAADDYVKFQKMNSFNYDDLFDPEINVSTGSWYLGRAIKRWEGRDNPIPFALAEYNAGRRHALRWAEGSEEMTAEEFIENIDFPTTKDYINTIIKKYEEYQKKPK